MSRDSGALVDGWDASSSAAMRGPFVTIRAVAIDNGQRTAGIVDVDPSITDEQIAYQCAMYGLTCDCEALGLDDYGPPDFLPDQRVTTLVELDNYLRTVPRI